MNIALSNIIITKLNKIWKDISIQIHVVLNDGCYPIHVHYKSTYLDSSVDAVLSWRSLDEMLFNSNLQPPAWQLSFFELLKTHGTKLHLNTYNKIKYLECDSTEELMIKLDLLGV